MAFDVANINYAAALLAMMNVGVIGAATLNILPLLVGSITDLPDLKSIQ